MRKSAIYYYVNWLLLNNDGWKGRCQKLTLSLRDGCIMHSFTVMSLWRHILCFRVQYIIIFKFYSMSEKFHCTMHYAIHLKISSEQNPFFVNARRVEIWADVICTWQLVANWKKCIIGFEFHPHKISFMNFNIISIQRKKAWKKNFGIETTLVKIWSKTFHKFEMRIRISKSLAK